jgi:hypothetical protein
MEVLVLGTYSIDAGPNHDTSKDFDLFDGCLDAESPKKSSTISILVVRFAIGV